MLVWFIRSAKINPIVAKPESEPETESQMLLTLTIILTFTLALVKVSFFDAFVNPNSGSVALVVEYMNGGSLQVRLALALALAWVGVGT